MKSIIKYIYESIKNTVKSISVNPELSEFTQLYDFDKEAAEWFNRRIKNAGDRRLMNVLGEQNYTGLYGNTGIVKYYNNSLKYKYKYNIVDESINQLVFDKWLDILSPVDSKIYKLGIYGNQQNIYNLYNAKTNQLFYDAWFADVDIIENIYARVKFFNGYYNIMNKPGEFLLDDNYKSIESVSWPGNSHKFLEVKNDKGKSNYIDLSTYQLIGDLWIDKYGSCYDHNFYNYTDRYDVNNYLGMELNSKRNLYDIKKRKALFPVYVDNYTYDKNIDKFILDSDNKYNLYDIKQDKLLFNDWYDDYNILDKNSKYYIVILNGKVNIIDTSNGDYIFDKWYDDIRKGDAADTVNVLLNHKWKTISLD